MQPLGKLERDADDRYTLRITRQLDAPLEEAWAALTERDSLEGWLGRVVYEPCVGSPLTIDFGDPAGIEIWGHVITWDPPHAFGFTWSPTAESAHPDTDPSIVHFELTPAGPDQTTLHLTHTRQPPAMARTTAAGWHAHADMLQGHVTGDTPAWESVYPPARDAYEGMLEAVR